MNRKTAQYNNQKLSKVIELSMSYKNHRRVLSTMKPALGIPSIKQIQRLDTLTTNKIRYAQQARHFKNNQLRKNNEEFIKRLQKTQSIYKRVVNPEKINTERSSNSRMSKKVSRLDSRQSLHSCSSQRSVLSNYQSRKQRYKQIKQENRKIADRISHPKIVKNMRIKELDKSYAKEQQYMKIRSRFSERSKSIMQALMLDGLKMDKKNLQFLPQINSPAAKYLTLNSSKKSLQISREKSQKKNRTLNIARNIQNSRNQ